MRHYRLGVDVGGTFTDFLLHRASGPPRAAKTPSTPADPAEGVLAGLAELAQEEGRGLADFLADVEVIVHGTTVTTNAVLTGDVARVGLITTRGFRDALAMRRGIREAQYDNRYQPPPSLVPRWLRLGVTERVDVNGREVTPLDEDDLADALARLRAAGVGAVAIAFLHSWANPAHEVVAERAVRAALPDAYVSRSSAVLPQVRFTERVTTTVLNAAVGPVLSRYLGRLTERLGGAGFRGRLLVMQSSGGVATPAGARTHAATTLLSGPAAAPVAGLGYVAPHGVRDFITVDMGGTSFDVCLVKDGAPSLTTEGRIARYPLGLPALAIHTIGAGGGSIAWIDDGGLLRMGPKSAGAVPGPACYRRGGMLPTCTDADLILGHLDAGSFLGGRLRLDPDAARAAVATLAAPLQRSVEQAAAGMVAVIDANMAAGIRHVTVERGHDPRDFLLVAGGGAGPVHAAGIARELGLGRILVPRDSSILCAAGLVRSDLRHDDVRSCAAPFDALEAGRLVGIAAEVADGGRHALAAGGIAPERVRVELACDVRYVGQYHEIPVPWLADEAGARDLSGVAKRFHEAHDRLYGYALPGTALELVNIRGVAIGVTDKPALPDVGRASAAVPRGRRAVWDPEQAGFVETPIWDGEALGAGATLAGPAVIEMPATAVVVPAGWRVEVDRHGSFLMELGAREQIAVVEPGPGSPRARRALGGLGGHFGAPHELG
ncbi:MAG: hydantoinase/oxoprolinase family protein [Candidatus Rokubacteria bacterium]|nr:hydantoinase/oxoprolinase family protein [Candidatus Rokubacteria bacterium]